MVFDAIFERFAEFRPACVAYRALMENIFAPEAVDALFRRTAEKQYEREFLFSTLVNLASQVVCRSFSSMRAAFLQKRDEITVSIRAMYHKLNGVEVGTSRALVQHSAARVSELIDRCKGARKPLLKGYHVRILDGNHLRKTDHRLKVLRKTAAGALPGHSLVLLDPQRMVIEDVVCCEDGHAQERSLLKDLLPSIRKRDLLIADRNFCTLGFLFALMEKKAFFITRKHGRMPWQPEGELRYVGRCDTGRVYEQRVALCNPTTGTITHVRRVTIKLKSKTRDGDMEIHLLTNLPAKVSAVKVASLYRTRWTLEHAFNELTTHLRCELQSLGCPKAALFGFCVAVCSYNLLAGVKGALRGVHGEETMETKVSNYYLTHEITATYDGMMVAVPLEDWLPFQTMSPARLAAYLNSWARNADLDKYPKQPRGPKKPRPKRPNAQFKHVSTAKLLDADLQKKKKQQRKLLTTGP